MVDYNPHPYALHPQDVQQKGNSADGYYTHVRKSRDLTNVAVPTVTTYQSTEDGVLVVEIDYPNGPHCGVRVWVNEAPVFDGTG